MTSPVFEIHDLDGKYLHQWHIGGLWWREKPEVEPHRLKRLTITHYDLEDCIHYDGKLMVLDVIAPAVLNIFKQLFELRFPIHSLKLIDEFDGSDSKSMEANNSSAFNSRNITANSKRSLHSYGLAIDINPIQNPFIDTTSLVGQCIVKPAQGTAYLNRSENRPSKINRPGLITQNVVDIFKRNGLSEWGGNWNDPIDYQHFQVP